MHDEPDVLQHRPQRWLRPAALGGAALAVLIVAGGLVSRVSASQALKTRTDAEAIPTVAVISPTPAAAQEGLVLPGQVRAFYDAQIHARVPGYLKRWYTDIGARVKAGQVLAEIDTPDLDQQLARAQADLSTAIANQSLAQVTAGRWKTLLGDDAVSHQEADEKASDLAAKSALVKAASAEVGRLRALEAFKRITAPFDGVVTGRTTDIGALIAAGAPNDAGLFTVSDVHRLRIYVKAPQAYTAQLHPGMTATLTVPEHPGQTFTATLVSTNGAVSDQSGAMTVELQMDNPAGAQGSGTLDPGDYAQVRFALPTPTGVLRLPASAVMFRRKGTAVAVLGADGRAHLRYVTIAEDQGSSVEIAGGLTASDRVIDSPPDSLADGEAVRLAAQVRPVAAQEG
ncbi:efflux RND transporter periplasmic adaptor subunit [Caulobacter sp. KR2-114]|uniref:efflux RND transporter periplasmic adaptor subunit n=1 Tax=Caulobacter sp. KR2-114 TaxID=3400912 RepID=UPI003C01B2FD